jgi:hypothetical protein
MYGSAKPNRSRVSNRVATPPMVEIVTPNGSTSVVCVVAGPE